MGIRHVKGWLIALITVIAASAHAQTFPSKTIRIIVPYPAGGSIDLTARVLARKLQDSVGQPVIVENKPGANAAIGIDALMRSDPDGHTLVILSDSPVTINVHLMRLNYDPLTDLVPISKVVSSPIIMSANARAGIASIADLVAAAKAQQALDLGAPAAGDAAGIVGGIGDQPARQHLADLVLHIDHVAALDPQRHQTTSAASETIFMKFRRRSSRATAPKMRVPFGLFSLSSSTIALRSKRT